MSDVYTDEQYLHFSSSRDEVISYLFRKYHNKIYHYALKVTKSEVLAEDILQDVFVKLFEYQDLHTIKNMENFMMSVTRNHTLNILKRRQFELKQRQTKYEYWYEPQSETEEAIYLNDSQKNLQRVIQQLPDRQRDVFNLCHIKGLKYKEAAKLLSLSPLTIKKHMQLALQFMRSYAAKNDLFILICAVITYYLRSI
ncbi:sigma-70 family RNA polymerase sigma factor [Chitinophaga agrisoli]|uniref:Sigma-70 family RNA polymerase sigma factor n=1 Tax=Chitinophaga agrisoli TaxID=2607653 RepID=A0A5B2VPN4_9BACT|nr:sigma-70 family RNA polymerase sigma factor [Chitinophaga agrisoli]KAA2240049.1 sigma-70 family RNA polymerase sigma factor [Chitinophaga agrisoli]